MKFACVLIFSSLKVLTFEEWCTARMTTKSLACLIKVLRRKSKWASVNHMTMQYINFVVAWIFSIFGHDRGLICKFCQHICLRKALTTWESDKRSQKCQFSSFWNIDAIFGSIAQLNLFSSVSYFSVSYQHVITKDSIRFQFNRIRSSDKLFRCGDFFSEKNIVGPQEATFYSAIKIDESFSSTGR